MHLCTVNLIWPFLTEQTWTGVNSIALQTHNRPSYTKDTHISTLAKGTSDEHQRNSYLPPLWGSFFHVQYTCTIKSLTKCTKVSLLLILSLFLSFFLSHSLSFSWLQHIHKRHRQSLHFNCTWKFPQEWNYMPAGKFHFLLSPYLHRWNCLSKFHISCTSSFNDYSLDQPLLNRFTNKLNQLFF